MIHFNWSVLSVYLWWGSGAMYCYPKPNPKSLLSGRKTSEVQVKQRNWMNIGKKKKRLFWIQTFLTLIQPSLKIARQLLLDTFGNLRFFKSNSVQVIHWFLKKVTDELFLKAYSLLEVLKKLDTPYIIKVFWEIMFLILGDRFISSDPCTNME